LQLGYVDHKPWLVDDTAGVIKSFPKMTPQAWHWDDAQHDPEMRGFVECPDERTLISFVGLTEGCKLDVRPSTQPFRSYDTIRYGKGDIIYLPVSREHRGCGSYLEENYRLYIAPTSQLSAGQNDEIKEYLNCDRLKYAENSEQAKFKLLIFLIFILLIGWKGICVNIWF
jgi:hypothetical protein